jgi:hypothetical protein
MEPDAARKAFLEYRQAVRSRHNEEDATIMRGYKELAAGHQVLHLHDVMKAAGVDEKNLPKLAICRSDAKWCHYDVVNAQPTFLMDEARFYDRVRKDKCIRLPQGMLPAPKFRARAMVPTVPAGLRPTASLANYFTLWEADWQKVPVDPMLLKHIGGMLYAVLAVWDLTELERAVLAGRLTEGR